MGLQIITAGRGEGKTTYLRRYAAHAAEQGRSVGGIASLAVFEDRQRLGYDLLDLRRGRTMQLARVVNTPNAEATVGPYKFDSAAIDEGNAAIVSAVRDNLDVIAIDEVGRLELQGGGWAPAVETALNECAAAQELIMAVRSTWVDELPDRFPSPLWASARRVSPPWPTR